MLPWTEKKRLKRLAYKLANFMENEFMHEFDTDIRFKVSSLYKYGAIASKAAIRNIMLRGALLRCRIGR
jgi:hypothetical protein